MDANKRDRHAAIRRLVVDHPIASQGELVGELSALGFKATQATVSRDIAELGLAKVSRGDRSVYVVPEAISAPRPRNPDTASQAPSGRPSRVPMSTAVRLTRSDRPTIASNRWSKLPSSESASEKVPAMGPAG